jgi:hypothetical protein
MSSDDTSQHMELRLSDQCIAPPESALAYPNADLTTLVRYLNDMTPDCWTRILPNCQSLHCDYLKV